MGKKLTENEYLCKLFGVAVCMVGDVAISDRQGNPIPAADLGKWFVAVTVGTFERHSMADIPLSATYEEAIDTAVSYLNLDELAVDGIFDQSCLDEDWRCDESC